MRKASEPVPLWLKLTIGTALAGSLVGIHNRARSTALNIYYDGGASPPPGMVADAWTKIEKQLESKQTESMRHQYTDFGSNYRGAIQKAFKTRLSDKTVYEKVRGYFNPKAGSELSPFSELLPANVFTLSRGAMEERALTHRYSIEKAIRSFDAQGINPRLLRRLALKRTKETNRFYINTDKKKLLDSLKLGGDAVRIRTMPEGRNRPLFHGLETGYRTAGLPNENELLGMATGSLGRQISTATVTIGNLGIVVRGDIKMASTTDLKSQKLGHGLRAFGETRGRGKRLVTGKDILSTNRDQAHNEYIANAKEITAVWHRPPIPSYIDRKRGGKIDYSLREEFDDVAHIERARTLSKSLGVPLMEAPYGKSIKEMLPLGWQPQTKAHVMDSKTHPVLLSHRTKIGHTKFGDARTPKHLFGGML